MLRRKKRLITCGGASNQFKPLKSAAKVKIKGNGTTINLNGAGNNN